MGREKDHIVALSFLYDIVNVGRDPIILRISPAGIAACHIAPYVQSQLVRPKDRLGVNLIVPFFRPQQRLVIQDRQKRR